MASQTISPYTEGGVGDLPLYTIMYFVTSKVSMRTLTYLYLAPHTRDIRV